jgi:hypothetical protein
VCQRVSFGSSHTGEGDIDSHLSAVAWVNERRHLGKTNGYWVVWFWILPIWYPGTEKWENVDVPHLTKNIKGAQHLPSLLEKYRKKNRKQEKNVNTVHSFQSGDLWTLWGFYVCYH